MLLDATNRAVRRLLIARGVKSERHTVRGHDVHAYRLPGTGSGPPVLLVHGLGSSANAYSRMLRPLAERFQEIWAVDLPGNGFSPLPSSGPLPLRELVGVLLAFREERIGRRVFLVGNSLGGAMSLFAAHEAPAAFAALALISPAGAPMSPARIDGLKRSFTVTSHAEARRMTRRLFHRAPLPALLFAGELRTLYGSPSVKAILGEVGPADSVTAEMLRGLSMPTLLLWGQSERLLPYDGVDYFRAHLPPTAEVHEVRGFGHMPQMERPAEVVGHLTRFADERRLEG